MERIDKTLKKIAGSTSKANMPTSSTTEPPRRSQQMPGDPNCPVCGGVGFVRQDLPIDDPQFGKLQICACRQIQSVDANIQRLYRMSNLQAFESMRFENFNPQGRLGLGDAQVRSLKLAQNQCQQFARELKGWVLLMGGYGCGKTHLAAAIANFAVSVGVPTLFLTVPDLLDWLRFSYDDPQASFESRFEEIRNIRLLVLDDLGTQNATPWAQEKLYQIINYRYTHKLPLVVTTNMGMNDLEGRVRSRLEDPDLVSKLRIQAPDFRDPVGDAGQIYLSALHFYSAQTFGSFSMREQEKMTAEDRDNLKKAFQQAQQFAENPRGWMVIHGKSGTGKTHLAAAIGNFRALQGDMPMFMTVQDLLDHLRSTFNPNSQVSYDKLFDDIRSVSLLILDDLGAQSSTPWAKEKLYQILNHRYIAELPTVITTSMMVEDIDERIRSRILRMCRPFVLTVPPYRNHPVNENQPKNPRGRTANKTKP
jgi:DNA replication protein DnaC